MMKWQPTEAQVSRAITKTVELRTSTKPQWRDARKRLEALGIAPEDAVLAEWQPEGQHFMFGQIVNREGRLFIFNATFDYDPSGQPLAKGIGWINRWEELAPEEAHLIAGRPNTYAQAAMVGRLIFEREHEG